jgi:hypothetical protein
MQRVDDDRRTRDRQPRIERAPAEPVEQRRLALPGKPGRGDPIAMVECAVTDATAVGRGVVRPSRRALAGAPQDDGVFVMALKRAV